MIFHSKLEKGEDMLQSIVDCVLTWAYSNIKAIGITVVAVMGAYFSASLVRKSYIFDIFFFNTTKQRKLEIFNLVLVESDPWAIENLIFNKNIEFLKSQLASFSKLQSLNSDQASKTPANEIQSEVEDKIKRWDKLARLFWGRSNFRCCSVSSWYYALTAEGNVCLASMLPESEAFKYWRDAAQRFHWAANQFRNIGQLDKGIDYYFLSATCYSRLAKAQKDSTSLENDLHNNLKQVRRSLERGMAICNSVGESAAIWSDEGTPSQMKSIIKELASDDLDKSYLNFKREPSILSKPAAPVQIPVSSALLVKTST